jgi:hypothetical protein
LIENKEDENTLKVLNNNIYNIQTDYIKIGTINIRKGYTNKIEDIINFCIDKSYHIMALTEIGKVNNPTNKPQLSKRDILNVNMDKTQTYHTYTYNEPHNANEGVGVIFNDHIAKHIVKIEGFKNRVLIINMCFRKNINIKVIIVYLPADNKDYKLTEMCTTFIENQITDAFRKNAQIIMMGDFNTDIKEIKNHRQVYQRNWKLKKELITFINNQHLIDNIKSFHDTPPNTWTSESHDNLVKCLDYIYTTQEILDHTFYGYVEAINDTYFSTDHKVVAIVLDKEYFLKYRQNSEYCKFEQNSYKIIYKNIPTI